jgi:hypothetical protein
MLPSCLLHYVGPGSIPGAIHLVSILKKAARGQISFSEDSGCTWVVIFQRIFGVLSANIRGKDKENITGFSLQS